MARPRRTPDNLAERLIAAAEAQLEDSAGRRLVLSDLARDLGISQPYVHRFFPTKGDLVRALAARWFERVEAVSEAAAIADTPPAERLEAWVLGVLRVKRDKFDANPVLFDAYLDLAQDHMDLVGAHVGVLRGHLQRILGDWVPHGDLAACVTLVEDATLLFRTPLTISRYRPMCTDARARAVLQMLALQLNQIARSD